MSDVYSKSNIDDNPVATPVKTEPAKDLSDIDLSDAEPETAVQIGKNVANALRETIKKAAPDEKITTEQFAIIDTAEELISKSRRDQRDLAGMVSTKTAQVEDLRRRVATADAPAPQAERMIAAPDEHGKKPPSNARRWSIMLASALAVSGVIVYGYTHILNYIDTSMQPDEVVQATPEEIQQRKMDERRSDYRTSLANCQGLLTAKTINTTIEDCAAYFSWRISGEPWTVFRASLPENLRTDSEPTNPERPAAPSQPAAVVLAPAPTPAPAITPVVATAPVQVVVVPAAPAPVKKTRSVVKATPIAVVAPAKTNPAADAERRMRELDEQQIVDRQRFIQEKQVADEQRAAAEKIEAEQNRNRIEIVRNPAPVKQIISAPVQQQQQQWVGCAGLKDLDLINCRLDELRRSGK